MQLVDLIEYIDNSIKNCVTEVRQFGLCHLLQGDNETFPATIESNAKKATPDDRFLITTYHRILNGNLEAREDVSFGKTMTAQNNQRMRMVVFVRIDQPETKIDDIINAMPDSFDVTDYEFANVSKNISLQREGDAIWTAEFSTAYKDKYQKKWNVYAVEYDLQYIKCNVCV